MLPELYQALPASATYFLFSASILFVWRFYMFTLKPWLWPSQPKDLPYWIPFLGHTVSFFRDYVKLIEDGLNYTSRTREPFSVQLLGQKLYICTSPEDVSTVFDNNVHFNFDNHLTNLLTSFGISKQALERAWHVPKPGEKCFIPNNPLNPKQKSLIHYVEDIYRQQLLPGDRMDVWAGRFLGSVKSSLRDIPSLDFCTTEYLDSSEFGEGAARKVSLYQLVSYFSIEATARAMFGPHLHDIDSSVVDHMTSFNQYVWMVVFRCPNIWGLPVDEPQKKLMECMRTFVRLPEVSRSQASWAIQNSLKGMEAVDMDLESRAAMMLMIFWAAVSNEHNSCFWVLTHLFHDDTLMKLVKAETEAAWKDGDLDIKLLCANCPNLDAIFNEVLRLNNTAAAGRATSRETIVGGKVLPAGSTIIMPYRQLHVNEYVWGNHATDFDSKRFLRKKTLARSTSFRPFGGGATLCPGQTLARHEVFGFIAILLHRFQVGLASDDKLETKQPFPQLDSSRPSLGINGPKKGMDVIINIAAATY